MLVLLREMVANAPMNRRLVTRCPIPVAVCESTRSRWDVRGVRAGNGGGDCNTGCRLIGRRQKRCASFGWGRRGRARREVRRERWLRCDSGDCCLMRPGIGVSSDRLVQRMIIKVFRPLSPV